MMHETQLERLPLRAIVAFAARCARRVRPLYRHPDAKHQASVDEAIRLAELFAAGSMPNDKGLEVAFKNLVVAIDAAHDLSDVDVAAADTALTALAAAKSAYLVASDDYSRDNAIDSVRAAINADRNARDAAFSLHDDEDARFLVRSAATSDFVELLELDLGDFPEVGEPVDPAETGALGPLWPNRVPEGFGSGSFGKGEFGYDPGGGVVPGAPPITVYFDVAEFSDEEIAEGLSKFSELYHALSGDVLVIDKTETLDPSRVLSSKGV